MGGTLPTIGSTARASWLDSTQVAAGVGMTFGDVQIDGLIATSGAANDTYVGAGSSAPTNTNSVS